MSLPVSQYEALLAQVRGLRRQAQHVQQLAEPLLFGNATFSQEQDAISEPVNYNMETVLLDKKNTNACYGVDTAPSETSENESASTHSTHHSVSSEPVVQNSRGVSSLYHGTWPVERTMWNSDPITITQQSSHHRQIEVPSVMSFASSAGAPLERILVTPDRSRRSSQQLEAKVDMVYSLLAMLGGQEHADMGETLLALSTNPESCLAMRESGCIPLLVQLVQSDRDSETRKKALKALHNLVHSQPDEKLKKRESRILKLLETVCAYNEALKNNVEFTCESLPEDGDRHPIQTIAHLMKLSFDEGHRQAICQLGGIHSIAKLVEEEHSTHGSTTDESHCILMRRYACMALTNLTFGDSGNKTLLCSYKNFITALVVQLQSPSDELRQVTASVLRNLSWRADLSSKEILREAGTVESLMKSAMMDNKENTLKSILSALWNLSAHCTENKSEICGINGALAFLVHMLLYKSVSKSLAIIENAGGILRNISSQIAVRDDYREILRQHNCLQILLDQLKSPSLTIVSNACGTLWNLSAKNTTDQELLWQLGAPSMLRSLNHSKHKMIAMGSSATLKNLLSAKPGQALVPQLDSTALSLDLPALPTLGMRKQKALLKDLGQNLTETFDNIEPIPNEKKVKNKQNQKDISPSCLKSPTIELANTSFASLNFNEPSTSFSYEKKTRIPQCGGPSSLPHLGSDSKNPCTSTPNNSKYSEEMMDHSRQSFNKKSSKKSAKNAALRKYSDDLSLKPLNFKLEYEFSSHSNEISSIQLLDHSLEHTGVDNLSPCVNAVKNSRSDYIEPLQTDGIEVSRIQMEEDIGVIDNDKHKTTGKYKEIIGNMDEKDHCSTEDVSDSEVQLVQVNETTKNDDFMEKKYEQEKDTRINSSYRTKEESNSNLSMYPSPRPRKVAPDVRPQPAPRLLLNLDCEDDYTKLDNEVTNTDVDSDFCTTPENLVQIQFSNIVKQEESVEDNTLQRDEVCEKQDLGREKPESSNGFLRENDVSENVHDLQSERIDSSTSSGKIISNSRLQIKSHPINSRSIPKSLIPSRNSSSKPQNEENVGTELSRDTEIQSKCVSEEVTKPISNEKIVLPISSREISTSQEFNQPQQYNMTLERQDESFKVLNEKYDSYTKRKEQNDAHYSDPQICSSSKQEKSICARKTRTSGEDILDDVIDKETNPHQPDWLHNQEECFSSIKPTTLSSDIASMNSEETECDFGHNKVPTEKRIYSDGEESKVTKSKIELPNLSPEYNKCLVFNDKNGERLERSCNESGNVVDTRMLDPDAMIESLDRFTAELVSQASSHLQNKDSLYKSSTNDNTWDEHSSPNEITFPSISGSVPNVVSFKSDNDTSSKNGVAIVDVKQKEKSSDDFNSIDTTMSRSTLIAMEATKIAVALNECDMSQSASSLMSLELDQIQPPSHLNSLSNSMIGFDSKPNSPKMIRKKSLPSNIMARRALNHSLSHTSSVESIEHQFMTNIECVDVEPNTKNISNFQRDGSNSKKNFIVNGPVNRDHMQGGTKAPSSLLHLLNSDNPSSVYDIENINPPSLFNEITDLCNSLADVATSAICSETEIFEDCFTHIADENLRTENDATEFSDATSITPIQSDVNSSSSENTPRRQRTLSKSLTTKQRRTLAKERYKTYTIAAGMVMKDSIQKEEESPNELNLNSEDFKMPDSSSDKILHSSSERFMRNSDSETKDVEIHHLQNTSQETSFQQERQNESGISNVPDSSPSSNLSKSRISVRKSFIQKRLTNKERFKTQTLDDTQFSSELPVCYSPPIKNDSLPITDESDLHIMVEREANKVVKTLNDTKTQYDELLDCETLSLVSNEDESEYNSGGSVNYRTYHKSWGLKHNIPVIDTVNVENEPVVSDHEIETNRVPRKPKIVKPDEKKLQDNDNVSEEQPKGIRGRRKPLYCKNNLNKITPKTIKPVRNVTSNLVKNITSTLKSVTPAKPSISKPDRISSKPPVNQVKSPKVTNRAVSYNGSPHKTIPSQPSTPSKISSRSGISRPLSDTKCISPRPLERQGTFTKDENPSVHSQVKSKIPGFTSKIPAGTRMKSTNSKIPSKLTNTPARSSLDRNTKVTNVKTYNRSTSADSRDIGLSRKLQNSLSTHSLKNDSGKIQQCVVTNTIQSQRSSSNTSLNGSNNTKKQVTSKIASIWKKIEETKKKTPLKNDSKKWIEAQTETTNHIDSDGVVLRSSCSDDNTPKRVSRLGSFIVMDENEGSSKLREDDI